MIVAPLSKSILLNVFLRQYEEWDIRDMFALTSDVDAPSVLFNILRIFSYCSFDKVLIPDEDETESLVEPIVELP